MEDFMRYVEGRFNRWMLLVLVCVSGAAVTRAQNAIPPPWPDPNSLPVRPVQAPFTVEGALAPPVDPNASTIFLNERISKPWQTDLELRRNIQGRLVHDTNLRPFRINVEARDGVVTLTGRVSTFQDRQRAEQDAYAARALVVQNRLEVAGY